MSGWMRAALCSAALAAAVTVFSSSATDLPPPIQDTGSNPGMARAAIDYVYLCGDCHGGIGEGDAAHRAPPLAGRSARDLEQQLARLSARREATGWPDHARVLAKLKQEDIDAIAAYLASLVPPPAIATH